MSMVLLIDDEPQMSKLVTMCLADTPAKVVRAANLAEALAVSRVESPTVVLLDLSLGGEDGLAMVPGLRRESTLAEIPIIAFSVHDSRKAEALAGGVNGFIAKPFKPVDLRGALAPFLG